MHSARVTSIPAIRLDDALRGRVRVGVVGALPIQVAPSGETLIQEIDRLGDRMRERYAGRPPAQIDALGPARDLYRSFGIDPTKKRPSSEALLRRLLKGKAFPRISNAVDLSNYLAVRFLLPIGLYDADRIEGCAVMRRGLEGETYTGIRKAEVHLEGRPVVADDLGPFGNPTSDSLRTSVTETTRAMLLVLFAPAGFSSDTLDSHLSETAAAVRSHLGDPAVVGVSRIDGWDQ